MNRFVKDITGGLAIIGAAALLGVVHNAVRGQSVPLIQKVDRVSTVRHGGNAADAATVDGVSDPDQMPEGAVTARQVRTLIEEGAYVIDARAPEPYAEGHIPGAINIPYDRLPEYYEDLASRVPIDATVVVYCWSPTCDFSDQLATELKIMGYANIQVFTGGWEHWQEAGYPQEKGNIEG